MARKTRNELFPDRVRFNWGYHDAAQVVRHGWDRPGKNFGFSFKPELKIETPADVLAHHFDRAYAEGWVRGYRAAKEGRTTESSEPAWAEYQAK